MHQPPSPWQVWWGCPMAPKTTYYCFCFHWPSRCVWPCCASWDQREGCLIFQWPVFFPPSAIWTSYKENLFMNPPNGRPCILRALNKPIFSNPVNFYCLIFKTDKHPKSPCLLAFCFPINGFTVSHRFIIPRVTPKSPVLPFASLPMARTMITVYPFTVHVPNWRSHTEWNVVIITQCNTNAHNGPSVIFTVDFHVSQKTSVSPPFFDSKTARAPATHRKGATIHGCALRSTTSPPLLSQGTHSPANNISFPMLFVFIIFDSSPHNFFTVIPCRLLVHVVVRPLKPKTFASHPLG